MSALGRRLLPFIIIAAVALMGRTALGQEDLDRNKSGAKLFAAICKDCHRRPRGLAKGRFSLSLYFFLQRHYTSGTATAWTLSAYLESVDNPPAKRKPAARKSRRKPKGASEAPLRPPASIPAR
jgi:hypothetical protein